MQKDRRAVDLHELAEIAQGMRQQFVLLVREHAPAAAVSIQFLEGELVKLFPDFLERALIFHLAVPSARCTRGPVVPVDGLNGKNGMDGQSPYSYSERM